MKTQLNAIACMLRSKLAGFFALCLVMGLSVALTPNVSFAQSGGTPPANATIQNSATASYKDDNGNTQTITSNTVTTTVQQIAAVTITPDNNKSGSAGGQVQFPHTITNNGNGTDTLDVTFSQTGDFTLTNITVYEDNGSGSPDFSNPLTDTDGSGNVDTGELAKGASLNVVVVADIPTTAQNNESQTLTVTTTSGFDGTKTDTATDIVSISDIVIGVTKNLSNTTGNTGDNVTVTLGYSSSGTDAAQSFVLKDTLDARFEYQAGTGKVNSATVTDADDGGDNFKAVTAGGVTIVTYTKSTVTSGGSGTVSFDVKIATGTEGDVIPNRAKFIYTGQTDPLSSNTTNYTVNETYSVVARDTLANTTTSYTNVTTDGKIIKGPANQGGTVSFLNLFENTGSTNDTYTISLSNQSNYPSGTTFTLFKADANGNASSPLTGNTTGSVAPTDTVAVIVRVSLPAGFDGTGTPSAPYDLTVTATSTNDANANDALTDELFSITANTVDLTNDVAVSGSSTTANTPGFGNPDGGEATAVNNPSVNPGTTHTFTLFINNTSDVDDNYNLAAGTATPGTPGSFSSGGLPSGYSVAFQTTGGAAISTTVSVPSGDNVQVNAVVTIPSTAAAGQTDIFFRALSSSTNATDVKHDAVTVNEVRSLSLVTDATSTISPGATVYYTGTLTNTGNVTENTTTASSASESNLQVQLVNSLGGNWQASVYVDADNSGDVSTGETPFTTASASGAVNLPTGSLAPGAQVKFIIKVTVAFGVANNTTNTSTLTVSDSNTLVSSVSLNDQTTVVAGNLKIDKFQSKTGGSGTYVKSGVSAKPGESIYYRITVENIGSATVDQVVVSDATPNFTTIDGNVSYTDASSTTQTTSGGSSTDVSAPAIGSAGTVQVTVGDMAAGDSITIEFKVKINN